MKKIIHVKGSEMKVLIVEDEQNASDSILELIELLMPGTEVFQAFNIKQAYDIVVDSFGTDVAFLMDGKLGFDDSLQLIGWLRAKFPYPTPIIAMSSLPELRTQQVRVGCNYEAEYKSQTPDLLMRIIKGTEHQIRRPQ